MKSAKQAAYEVRIAIGDVFLAIALSFYRVRVTPAGFKVLSNLIRITEDPINRATGEEGLTMKIKTYRKTATIEAVQYNGSWPPAEQLIAWLGKYYGGPPRFGDGFLIRTLEGDHLVESGDWVVRGIEGEFWPIKDEIFDKTYVEV